MAVLQINHQEIVPGHPESLQQTTIDGVPCTAFTLDSGWVQDWDKGNIATGNTAPNERVEVSGEVAQSTLKGKSPSNVTPATGKEVVRLKFRFAAGFPASRWFVLDQFHPPDLQQGAHGFGGITGHGTNVDIGDPTDDSGSRFIYQAPIKFEAWYDWDLGINWASTADGYVVLVDRATGKQLMRWTGVTLPAGMPYKYRKQGYYRNPTNARGTVYQTLMDIFPGDISAATTPVLAPAPASTPTPTAQTVQNYATQLITARDAMRAQADAIDALLRKP